jgi:two-component system sensor histidine kinase ChiS
MQRQGEKLNQERVETNRKPINIGLGIHTGTLILGSIGEEERMQQTVISDAVNLASKVEGLTKLYRAPVLISRDTLELLENKMEYTFRFFGKVHVKGKTEPPSVYELLEGISSKALRHKIDLAAEFQEGLNLYYNKSFDEASVRFGRVLKSNPEDRAATLYRERCANLMLRPPPDQWNGIEIFETK